ncbi:MAG: hypothetical protein U0470_10100 [Anaerolineae bacterium]
MAQSATSATASAVDPFHQKTTIASHPQRSVIACDVAIPASLRAARPLLHNLSPLVAIRPENALDA